MQKETICEILYEGKFDPSQEATKNNPQYDEAKKQYGISFNALYDTFDNEQKKLYDDYLNKTIAIQDALVHRAFKVGIRLALDVFYEIKDIPL